MIFPDHAPASRMLFKELADKRRPDRHGVSRIDEEMPVVSEGGKQVILRVSPRGGKRGMHALGQLGSEIGVVFDIEPEHGYPRGAAEFSGLFDELVGGAIVVGL